MRATSHSGPIPDADSLAKYNNIIPNGADRIMAMAELQAEHRIIIEKSVVKTNNISTILGQVFGFLIGVLGLGSAIYLSLNNHETIAGILVGSTLVSLVGIFVIGKYLQSKE